MRQLMNLNHNQLVFEQMGETPDPTVGDVARGSKAANKATPDRKEDAGKKVCGHTIDLTLRY
jgi:hypothetical protein